MAECGELLQEEEKTDEQYKSKLAKKIVGPINFDNWQQLGKKLGLGEYELQDIHFAYVREKPNILEVCYQLVSLWKQKSPQKFSEKLLLETVEKIRREERIQQKRNQTCGGNVRRNIPAFHEQELLNEQRETLKKLETAQLKAYKGIEMEIAPWMTDTYIPLEKLYVELQIMFSANKYGNEDNRVLIHIDEIFNTTEGYTQQRRILVEGDAGFGKTTLLNKLVDDWTKKKDYIYQKFRNVFLFYLREFNKDQSFEDLIRIECKKLNIIEEEGLKCIRNFEKDTLFLLDGYDELSNDFKPKFQKLLLGYEFENATIIVTSRRGEFQRERNKKSDTGLSVNQKTRNDYIFFWDKRILISGISEENRIKFLQKYLQIENINDHFHIADKELFRCPLFLILLAIVKDEENVQMVDTQTDFYKFLLNVVTKRSLVRIHELDESKDVELFDSNHENYHEECAKQMDLFGSLAVQHLIKNDLTFTQEEIEECCGKDAIFIKLGFINKRLTYKNWNRKSYYEPFHKSFLEFFAAFTLHRLAAKSEESNQDEFKEKISDLVLENVIPNGTSLIYPFLAGLLNTGSFLLFDALSPWGSLLNIFEESFLDILIETRKPETIISSLTPFIPQILRIDHCFFSNSKYDEIRWVLFHKLFLSSLFKFQIVSMDYLFPFQIRTKNFEVQFIQSNLYRSSNVIRRDNFLPFECENLIYYFDNCDTNVWEDAKKFILHTKFNKLTISLDHSSDLIPLLHKELIEGFWKNFDIEELMVHENKSLLLNTTEAYFYLSDLVKNKRIKNMKFSNISVLNKNEINNETVDFLDWKCLNQISIVTLDEDERPLIPFSRLCQRLKKWKFIEFGTVFDYSLPNSNLCCSVEEICFNAALNKKSCYFVMKYCTETTTLSCDARCLITCFVTQHLSNLKELRLKFYEYEHFEWTKLVVLQRLHSLFIKDYSFQDPIFAKSFTSFVCQSKLEILDLTIGTNTLLIILQSFYNIGFEKEEINKTEIPSTYSEKDIQKNSCSNLKSLVIHWSHIYNSETVDLNKIMILVKLLLKGDFVKEIIFTFYEYSNVEPILSLLVYFPREGFLLSRHNIDNVSRFEQNIIITCPDPKLN